MMRLVACIAALGPSLATSFVVKATQFRSNSALLYQQHEGGTSTTSSNEQEETTERAKNCIEHFGECSIEELQELQSST